MDSVATKYTAESKIIINCTVTSDSRTASTSVIYASWESPSFDKSALQAATLLPTQLSVPISQIGTGSAGTQSMRTQLSLVLKPGALLPGQLYTFRLRASYSPISAVTADTSFSEFTILTNKPPTGGSITVWPGKGLALNTTFSIKTLSWVDDVTDLPISFSFASYIDSPNKVSSIRSYSTSSSVTTKLGQGLFDRYAVTIVALAADVFGASAFVTKAVMVAPITNKADLSSAINRELTRALKSSNADLVGVVVGAATAALNSASCANAPVCANLNRSPCSTASNLCGACLSGYMGSDGMGNSPCLPIAASGSGSASSSYLLSYISKGHIQERVQEHFESKKPEETQRLSAVSLTGRDGDPCVTSFQCLSGSCVKNACATAFKSCGMPSCSNLGQCIAVSSEGDPLSPGTQCAIQDRFCRTKCVCNSGAYGASCALSNSEFALTQQTREILCKTLFKTLATQNVDELVVIQRAQSVSSLLIDGSLLTLASIQNCSAALLSTVEQQARMSASDGVLDVVLDALSTILESTVSFTVLSTPVSSSAKSAKAAKVLNSIVSSVFSAVTILSTARLTHLAVGERDIPRISANIRLQTWKGSVQVAAGNVYKAPLTPLEATYRTPPATVAVNITGPRSSSGSSIGVTLVQYYRNFAGTMLRGNASNLELQTYFFDPSGEGVITSQALLQNKKLVDYSDGSFGQTPFRKFKCTYSSKPFNITTQCALGENRVLLCDGVNRGTFAYTCPSMEVEPICSSRLVTSGNKKGSCVRAYFTAGNTTCVCTHNLLASVNPVVSRYWVLVQKTRHGFAQNFSALSEPLKPTFSTSIVTVTFAAALVLSVILIGFAGYYTVDRRVEKAIRVKLKHRKEQLMNELKSTGSGLSSSPHQKIGNNSYTDIDINENAVSEFVLDATIHHNRRRKRKVSTNVLLTQH